MLSGRLRTPIPRQISPSSLPTSATPLPAAACAPKRGSFSTASAPFASMVSLLSPPAWTLVVITWIFALSRSSWRGSEASRHLLREMMNMRISKTHFSHGKMGELATLILGSGMLDDDLFIKIKQSFEGNTSWKASIECVGQDVGFEAESPEADSPPANKPDNKPAKEPEPEPMEISEEERELKERTLHRGEFWGFEKKKSRERGMTRAPSLGGTLRKPDEPPNGLRDGSSEW